MAACNTSQSVRPRGLFISPLAPAPTGNGLAMRAAVTVQGLARVCNLTTAVIPVSDPGIDAQELSWAAERSEHSILVPLAEPTEAARHWIANSSGRALVTAAEPLPGRARLAYPDAIAAALDDDEFDIVWTLRLYLAATALPYRGGAARLVLDIDEDDAATLRAIAELHRQRGESEAASRSAAEADAYARLAALGFGWFDRIVTSSDVESAALHRGHGLESVTTLANAVPVNRDRVRRPHDIGSPSLLFVGNMDYVPNLDAAEQLVTSILPALRQQASTADLHLVGSGDGATSLARYPGVTVHGFVDDLAPLYARADVAVIPLRAGGGSRVKILEAFAHGLPVVATSTAALGLDVENGDQLLIADTQADLVTAALHVVTDAKLAKHLVISAQRFVNENHDVDVIAGRISDQIQSWM